MAEVYLSLAGGLAFCMVLFHFNEWRQDGFRIYDNRPHRRW